jgi:hypothetical protein
MPQESAAAISRSSTPSVPAKRRFRFLPGAALLRLAQVGRVPFLSDWQYTSDGTYTQLRRAGSGRCWSLAGHNPKHREAGMFRSAADHVAHPWRRNAPGRAERPNDGKLGDERPVGGNCARRRARFRCPPARSGKHAPCDPGSQSDRRRCRATKLGHNSTSKMALPRCSARRKNANKPSKRYRFCTGWSPIR